MKEKGIIVMKIKSLIAAFASIAAVSASAAYQYNIKGNQGWMTFDSATTVAFELTTDSRKDKDNGQTNYIDRGSNYADFGWYNLETGARGSFKGGVTATFTENDRIGFWVKDNSGNVYTTTKPDKKTAPDNVVWGKTREELGGFTVAGGNFGSNGTQEYYVFKVSTANTGNKAPSGQPLPGILAVLAVGGAAFGAKKLYDKKKAANKQ